jgi:hypothetical protein
MKKNILLLFIVAIISNFGICKASNIISKAEQPKSWTLLMEKSGIQVFYKYADCNDLKNGIFQEMVYLKIVNTTNLNVVLDWDLKTWINNECSNCTNNSKEHHFSIKVNAGDFKSGSCETRSEFRELAIFSRFLNMENKYLLTKFSLENFTVKPL